MKYTDAELVEMSIEELSELWDELESDVKSMYDDINECNENGGADDYPMESIWDPDLDYNCTLVGKVFTKKYKS